MRTLSHTFAILAVITGFSSQASINGSDPLEDKIEITSMQSAVIANGIYKFTEETDVNPSEVLLNREIYDNKTGVTLSFEKGEAVAVEFDIKGNALITPLIAEEERGEIPEQFILSKAEFAKAHTAFFSPGDMKALATNFSPYVEETVASRHGHHHLRSRRHGRHIGNCVNYVKARIHIGGHWGDGKGAVRTLIGQHGWHSLGNCSSPPMGTVASWSGGWHGLGHTGIWNGRCFASDSVCGNPGHLYHFLGCAHP